MKINVFLIGIVGGLLFANCNGIKDKSAKELLENSDMKEKIYSEIISDTTHFLEFMNKFMNDDQSKILLNRNSSLVKMVCMSEKMDSLMSHDQQVMESLSNRFIKKMEDDSVVCDHTCTRLMESEYLKKYFREHGIGK